MLALTRAGFAPLSLFLARVEKSALPSYGSALGFILGDPAQSMEYRRRTPVAHRRRHVDRKLAASPHAAVGADTLAACACPPPTVLLTPARMPPPPSPRR